MAETTAELSARLQAAVEPGVRGRLLDKGLARGLIWREGSLPEGAPEFPESLSEDLLDYAHAVMALAMRLRAGGEGDPRLLERAFLVAGEAMESVVHRGEERIDQGFHRVTAAVAFHLGRYAARAFSMLPTAADAQNVAPTEAVLIHLLRRRLDEMHNAFSEWLLNPANADDAVAAKLEGDDGFDQDDAVHSVLTSSFMRGIALFDHALMTGSSQIAGQARSRLFDTADVALDFNAVSHWWTATLAAHLVDELWSMSLHERIPQLPPDNEDHATMVRNSTWIHPAASRGEAGRDRTMALPVGGREARSGSQRRLSRRSSDERRQDAHRGALHSSHSGGPEAGCLRDASPGAIRTG